MHCTNTPKYIEGLQRARARRTAYERRAAAAATARRPARGEGAASGVQPSYAAGYGSRLARSSPKSSSVADMTSTVADAAAGRASPVPAAPALGAQPASPTSATVHRAVESRSKHVRRRFVASSATLSSRTYASAPGQPRASYGRVRDACTISNLEYELGLERVRERQHAARRKCAQDAPGRLHVLHAR
jgi:hypothetical protein